MKRQNDMRDVKQQPREQFDNLEKFEDEATIKKRAVRDANDSFERHRSEIRMAFMSKSK